MTGFIPAPSLDKSIHSASQVLFLAVGATPIVFVIMLLLRKCLPCSPHKNAVFATVSPLRPARAEQSKAFWKKTMRRHQRRVLRAQDTQMSLIDQEQDPQEVATDVENIGFSVGTNTFQEDCHVLEIQVESLTDHAPQDDHSDEVQPHDMGVTEADMISPADHHVPGFEIAGENIAIHNAKFVCTCSESNSWGCIQHRAYAKELLLAHRPRLILPCGAGVDADGSSFFVLLAEPPGLERLTRTR